MSDYKYLQMTLLKKGIFYYKEFIFQTVVFFTILISPLGNIGWKIGIFETSWIESLIKNFSNEPKQLFIRFIIALLFSILYSFPISISNIYLWHSNKFRYGEDDYLLLKILFMIGVSVLYVVFSTKMYSYYSLLTLNFVFPIILTTLFYLVWLYWKGK